MWSQWPCVSSTRRTPSRWHSSSSCSCSLAASIRTASPVRRQRTTNTLLSYGPTTTLCTSTSALTQCSVGAHRSSVPPRLLAEISTPSPSATRARRRCSSRCSGIASLAIGSPSRLRHVDRSPPHRRRPRRRRHRRLRPTGSSRRRARPPMASASCAGAPRAAVDRPAARRRRASAPIGPGATTTSARRSACAGSAPSPAVQDALHRRHAGRPRPLAGRRSGRSPRTTAPSRSPTRPGLDADQPACAPAAVDRRRAARHDRRRHAATSTSTPSTTPRPASC